MKVGAEVAVRRLGGRSQADDHNRKRFAVGLAKYRHNRLVSLLRLRGLDRPE